MEDHKSPPKRKLPGVWKTYDNSSGLLAGVGSIAQARDGYLWLATFGGGLSRYDGVEFVNYTTVNGLTDNRVRHVVIDAAGRVWFRLWTHALYSYDGAQFTVHTQPDGPLTSAVALTTDGTGCVWIGSQEGGIYRYENGVFVPYLTHSSAFGEDICLFWDSRNHLWIGTHQGVWLYTTPTSGCLFTTKEGLIHDYVRAICEDQQGGIWLGTAAGLSRYDGVAFTGHTTENGLSHNEIWGLYCDRQGRIWISTFGGGVTCYDEPQFFVYDLQDGLLENSVNQIIEDREGSYWFCHTTTGLSRFDPGFFEVLTTDPVAEGGFTKDPEGCLWYGSYHSLGRIDGKGVTAQTLGGHIMSVLSDRQGGLWVGTWGAGIYHYPDRGAAGETRPYQLTQAHGLTDDWSDRRPCPGAYGRPRRCNLGRFVKRCGLPVRWSAVFRCFSPSEGYGDAARRWAGKRLGRKLDGRWVDVLA